MTQKHLFEGASYEEALSKGLESLGLSESQVSIKIVQEPKKKLFGSSVPCIIEITTEGSSSEVTTHSSETFNISASLKNSNGYFTLSFTQDGVVLSVYPGKGDGLKVDYDSVKTKIDKKRIEGVDYDAVKKAVSEQTGEKTIIAPQQSERKLNSELVIDVSPDKMQVNAILTPPDGGRILNYEEIIAHLKEKGVVKGILEEEIHNLVVNKIYNRAICIAKGFEPTNGVSGRVEYLFDTSKNKTPKLLEDGSVDFKQLDLIINVDKDQELAILIPPTRGKNGYRVTGEELVSIDGEPVELPQGSNTRVSEDKLKLLAEVSGQVSIYDGKVVVNEIYTVPANVDSSTGNITFSGNIVIKGNVNTGYTVEGKGDIEVYGVVEGATIISEGNIILRRGMQGMNKGMLKCKKDVVAKYLENTTVFCDGGLTTEAIMHSNISAGTKVEVKGKKGLIVGGSVRAGEDIQAKVIGSPMATFTEIEVGVNPELRKKYDLIKDEIEQLSDNLTKTQQVIDLLNKMRQTTQLPQDKQVLLSRSEATKDSIQEKLAVLSEDLQALETNLEVLSTGKIKVSGNIFPGTKITIGNSILHVRDNIKFATLYKAEGDIKVGIYS